MFNISKSLLVFLLTLAGSTFLMGVPSGHATIQENQEYGVLLENKTSIVVVAGEDANETLTNETTNSSIQTLNKTGTAGEGRAVEKAATVEKASNLSNKSATVAQGRDAEKSVSSEITHSSTQTLNKTGTAGEGREAEKTVIVENAIHSSIQQSNKSVTVAPGREVNKTKSPAERVLRPAIGMFKRLIEIPMRWFGG